MIPIHIHSGFYSDVPLGWNHSAKGVNELAADGWLTTAKSDSAARGEEIKIINHYLVEQLGWGDSP